MNKIIALFVAFLLTSACLTTAQAQQPTYPKVYKKDIKQVYANEEAFLKRNPIIANVHWKSGYKIVLKLKDDRVQTYDLNNLKQKQTFEAKYGPAPIPPPPPPPPVKQKHSK